MKKFTCLLLLAGFLSTQAFSQAIIDESIIQKTFYVNNQHSSSNDNNSGEDQNNPLKTIQAAVNKFKAADVHGKIYIYPGTYREYVYIESKNKFLVLEGKSANEVIISGSDVFKNWTNEGNGVYSTPWTYDFPLMSDIFVTWSTIHRHKEMAFIDGKRLSIVENTGDLKEGTFCVKNDVDKFYIKPAAGTNMSSALVELGVRGSESYGNLRNGALIHVRWNPNNNSIVIRNIAVKHTICTVKQNALSILEGKNVLVENCQFYENLSIGFEIDNSDYVTVRNCVANDNGERGMGMYQGNYHLWENCETQRNNWKYGEPILPHDAAGLKCLLMDHSVIRNLNTQNNYCDGLWLDWNNDDNTIENSTISNNTHYGLNIEASYGPLLVKNCDITLNAKGGILGYGFSRVTLDGCKVSSGTTQWNSALSIGSDNRTVEGSPVGNWNIESRDWTIKNCTIYGREDAYVMSAFLWGTEFRQQAAPALLFGQTLKSDYNYWYQPKLTKNFFTNNESEFNALPWYEQTMPVLTFDEWKSKTGQDAHSTWGMPSGSNPPTTLRNADNPSNTVAGLDYKYYEGTWDNLPNFSSLTSVKSGTIANVDLSVRNSDDNFAVNYTGFINVASDGTYTFYTSSDDGSKLYIGTTEVVNNDGLHGSQEKSGQIGLKAGKHAITINFFDKGGDQLLTASIEGPSLSKAAISTSNLYRVSTSSSSLRDPENPSNTSSGLSYNYYEGTWDAIPNGFNLTPNKTGTVTNISLSQRSRDDNFCFYFSGYINVASDGNYTFYTNSDDGSKLYIGSIAVVDNDGLHGAVEKSGVIGLKAGKHAIRVEYLEKSGDEVLEVRYEGPSISKQPIPDNAWFYVGTSTSASKLTGTVIGSTGSYQSSTNTRDKVFDGNTGTFFDGPESSNGNGLWAGLDLGSAKYISSIKYYPRASWANRMNGGKFQGSNNADFSNATDFYTLSSDPTYAWSEATINAANSFRYVRYLSPNAGWGNVAEVEFWGTTTKSAEMITSDAENNLSTVNIYPNPASTSVTVTIDEKLIGAALTIMSMDGKMVSSEILQHTINTINVSTFSEGLYIISIREMQNIKHKLIICR